MNPFVLTRSVKYEGFRCIAQPHHPRRCPVRSSAPRWCNCPGIDDLKISCIMHPFKQSAKGSAGTLSDALMGNAHGLRQEGCGRRSPWGLERDASLLLLFSSVPGMTPAWFTVKHCPSQWTLTKASSQLVGCQCVCQFVMVVGQVISNFASSNPWSHSGLQIIWLWSWCCEERCQPQCH